MYKIMYYRTSLMPHSTQDTVSWSELFRMPMARCFEQERAGRLAMAPGGEINGMSQSRCALNMCEICQRTRCAQNGW